MGKENVEKHLWNQRALPLGSSVQMSFGKCQIDDHYVVQLIHVFLIN